MFSSSMSDSLQPTTALARRRRVRIWLIIDTIVGIPAILIGSFMAIMSPMMFDAPGSTANPPVVLLFSSVIAFPVAYLLAIVSAWIAFAARRISAAVWLSFLPAVPLLGGIVSIVWLQFGGNGQFGR
jgi:hypothetical protein